MGGGVVNTVEIRLLGSTAVLRDGTIVPLPRSRKVRALLAYLALSPQPVTRSRLCDLFWDVPNDPRGELRWCLSKLRGLLDDDNHTRVVTNDDRVSLDFTRLCVDALETERAVRKGLDTATSEQLAELASMFTGDFLDGLDVDGSPALASWLSAQRVRFHTLHIDLLRALVERAGPEAGFPHLQRWLEVSPLDTQAHVMFLEGLAKTGRVRDAESHLAMAIRTFEAESVDWSSLRDGWQAVRGASSARIEIAPVVPAVERPRRRAKIAVLPLVEATADARVANGVTEDIIMQLARLRVLFVIGRGSVFALAEKGVGAPEAARVLDVDYYVTGEVRRDAGSVALRIELIATADGTIVWTDELSTSVGDTLNALDGLVTRIVAAIAEEIEAEESRRAVLKSPSSLDAWEAYHRGLWHMYKFTGPDNREAEHLFRTALGLDPTFARAHAGLSFTHFQNAFLELTPDRARQIDLAFESANHSLGADDHDPAAHWAMGRALWLRGEHVEAVAELERSVELSPNFALGHYTLGFVNAQKGDPQSAIASANHSRQLSPFDPLQFAMLASRALAHVRLDQRAEAAEWAVRATARPNAHAHILAIAAGCLSLANRRAEAERYVARIRTRLPSYSIEDFLRAFQFNADIERLFREGARSIGFAG
jgi:DNA-binding SARP family transcriptional activator/TolB-like protein/Tfp pilus assembly protein PilF